MAFLGARIFVAAAVMAAGLWAGAGAAMADEYGAIAFSQETGAHGYSFDYSSRSGAENTALDNCYRHAGDCQIAAWFVNSCGAIAVGDGNGWGVGYGARRRGVEQRAIAECRARTSGCRVLRWVCTSGN